MSDDPSATQAAGNGRRLRVGLGEALALVAAVLLVVSPFLATYSGHLLGRTYSYTGWHSLFIAELVATELLGALVGVVVVLAGLGLLPRSLPWMQWATGVAVAVLVGAIVSPIGYHQFLFQAQVRRSIGIGAGPYLAIGGAVVLLAGCVLASVPAINVALIGRPPKPAGALPAGSGYDQMPGYAQGGYPGAGGGYYGQPGPGQQMPGQPMPGQPGPGQQPTPGYGAGPSNPWSAPSQPASQTPSPWAPQSADAGPASTERAEQPGEPTPAWQQPVQPQPGQAQPGQPFGGQPYGEQPLGGQPQPGRPLGEQPEPAARAEQPTQQQPTQQQPAWQQAGQPQPGQPQPGQPQTGQPQTGQPQPGQPAWGEPSPWGLGAGSSSESPAGGTTQQPTGQQPTAEQEPAAGSFSPFWGAVPTPRTVFHPDNRQSPVGVVQPGAWYAVVAQQPGGALLVQMPDGSHALLTDTNDLIRA